jgi:hypothetical protein
VRHVLSLAQATTHEIATVKVGCQSPMANNRVAPAWAACFGPRRGCRVRTWSRQSATALNSGQLVVVNSAPDDESSARLAPPCWAR